MYVAIQIVLDAFLVKLGRRGGCAERPSLPWRRNTATVLILLVFRRRVPHHAPGLAAPFSMTFSPISEGFSDYFSHPSGHPGWDP
jgi:hypothetical protein